MHDGLAEGAVLGALGVHVYPLVVERGISKSIDAVLVHLQPFGNTEFLANVLFEIRIRIDCKHGV